MLTSNTQVMVEAHFPIKKKAMKKFPGQERQGQSLDRNVERPFRRCGQWGAATPGLRRLGLGAEQGARAEGCVLSLSPALQQRGEGRPALMGVSDSHPPASP